MEREGSVLASPMLQLHHHGLECIISGVERANCSNNGNRAYRANSSVSAIAIFDPVLLIWLTELTSCTYSGAITDTILLSE